MSVPAPSSFDFARALVLARRLTTLAERWESASIERRQALDRALATWRGPTGERIAARVEVESAAAVAVCEALRAEARWWAAAWASALDEHNRHRWRTVQVPEATELAVPAPAPVDVPRPPHFEPTGAVPAPAVAW